MTCQVKRRGLEKDDETYIMVGLDIRRAGIDSYLLPNHYNCSSWCDDVFASSAFSTEEKGSLQNVTWCYGKVVCHTSFLIGESV